MDVTESIRKRRFHRSFTDEPVDEEALAQLVWAAGRAPMGGNELVRRIVVVADPAVMRTVRQVTPSFLANAPAVLVICTDLERAEASMGIQGRDVLSLVDAGAAAENVALAAVALGLATCFVRSSNDVALQEVLGLPSGVRPDILIAVGHPAATPSPAMKNPPAVVYRDRFGSAWDEPLIYGPFRMIEGVSRMLEGQASDGFLTEMKAAIDREKYSVMADRASFARWLDDLLRDFAAEAGRRNAPAFKPAAPAIEGEKR
ncbi:MAG: hypothetical protein E6I63_00970 [Chloroflexi bacterium]|nr:MAG: hypothetical protein E6I63_00970 [Chloroflexota bacterium]